MGARATRAHFLPARPDTVNFVSAAVVGSLAVSENQRCHAGVTLRTVALFLFLVQSALTLG